MFGIEATTFGNLILLTGWPVLLGGSVFVFWTALSFFNAVKQNLFGRLVLASTIGWIVTMYSLGVVSTRFMLVNPEVGVPTVTPIFFIWFVTMMLIVIIVVRWKKIAVDLNSKLEEAMRQKPVLEKEIDQRTLELEQAKASLERQVQARTKELKELNDNLEHEIRSQTQELREKIEELEQINRLMVNRELKMMEMKQEMEALKKKKR